MKDRTVHAVYFSPAQSTRKIVETITEGISSKFIRHDITQGIKESIVFKSGEIAVIGVPSYSGRVPSLATQYLSEIKSKGAYAIIVCVYGNREYEDTLRELNMICQKSGFLTISSGAFIARHSIFPELAKGRPDKNDLEKARQFGMQSLAYLSTDKINVMQQTDNCLYRKVETIPFVPKTNAHCNNCGICISLCPVNAIDKSNPKKTNKKICITCAGCIERCPQNARRFKGILYNMIKKNFVKKYGKRKEVEVFFAE